MKILVNTPSLSALGGVSNHYIGLKKYWKSKVFYNPIGSRFRIPGFFLFPLDMIIFLLKLLCLRPSLVLLNPSLNRAAFFRDAFYLRIAAILGFKTIVFFHGWNSSFENKVSSWVFDKYYGKANAFIVLASSFKDKILAWSPNKTVYISTTKVEDDLLSGFTMESKPLGFDLIFFGRIQKEKGIYLALDAFKIIQEGCHSSTFHVVGDGAELSNAIAYTKRENISNVIFHGRLHGSKLASILTKANINIFPTFHGEGMPTSVLESMAFGLAILSRPIGGLVDFFEEGKMGHLTTSLDPKDYGKLFKKLASQETTITSIGQYNFAYAKQHFYASKVAKDLELIFQKVTG